jgi:hypothetical protein
MRAVNGSDMDRYIYNYYNFLYMNNLNINRGNKYEYKYILDIK